VAVGRLTRVQANYELFAYTLFLTVLFGVVGVASLSPNLPHGNSIGVPVYAFTVAAAAFVFGISKHPAAAAVCASAPVGALIYFALFGFHPNAGTGDKVLQVIICMAWLRYGWRVLRIAGAYPTLPEGSPPKPRR
jgi:hypothetical protein